MSFTAIEVDGPGGETITVAQTDGTPIPAHLGQERVVRIAPGLLGIDSTGKPYIDPAGVTAGEQAALGYDASTGVLFMRGGTDPAVPGRMQARRPVVNAASLEAREQRDLARRALKAT